MPNKSQPTEPKHIAIFGATGYIGTKVLIELYNLGHYVTIFVRESRNMSFINEECTLFEYTNTRICIASINIEEKEHINIRELLSGVDAVYYFIHSLTTKTENFLNLDNHLAELVASVSKEAGVKQIIYLGGLGIDRPDKPLSKHLKSRQETAQHLRLRHDCVTEFRAGVIIGEGSASFELIRALGDKLPFIPDLGKEEGYCQPIFVNDVIDYLTHALRNPLYYGQIVEIGCGEDLQYSDIVMRYVKITLEKKLLLIPMPFASLWLTPEVISWFAARLSGMPYILIYRLIAGAYCDAVVEEFPVSKIDKRSPISITSLDEAIIIASKRSEEGYINSAWDTPYEISVLNEKRKKQLGFITSQEKNGLIFDEYSQKIPLDKADLIFNRVKSIGGKNGYYSVSYLWKIRGCIDTFLGGPGLNNWARRSPKLMRVGDRIDFWVVTYYINRTNRKVLRLKANMKTPGNAWLQFSIEQIEQTDEALFIMRPYFDPEGLLGYLYWYSLHFIHKIIFKQMVKNLTKYN